MKSPRHPTKLPVRLPDPDNSIPDTLNDELIELLTAFVSGCPACETCHDLNGVMALAAKVQVAVEKHNTSPLNKFAFSAKETARLLSISERSLTRLSDRKLLCASRALKKPIYGRDAILSFLSATS